jgi:hypothetical protein
MTPSAILSASRQQHISFRTTAIHTMDRRSFDSNGRQASPTAAPVMRNHRPRFHGVAVGLCRRTDGRGALAAGACYGDKNGAISTKSAERLSGSASLPHTAQVTLCAANGITRTDDSLRP